MPITEEHARNTGGIQKQPRRPYKHLLRLRGFTKRDELGRIRATLDGQRFGVPY